MKLVFGEDEFADFDLGFEHEGVCGDGFFYEGGELV
jgi:hypothetical protein